MPRTVTVIGIDEAGYGPLLGPLVISAVAFDVPVEHLRDLEDEGAGPDLWSILRASLTPRPLKKDPRLAVADSKKLYSGCNSADGLNLLERAAMAFIPQAGRTPLSLRGLLEYVCPEAVEQLSLYPWYGDAQARLPVCCKPDDLAIQRNALASDMARCGVRFRGVWSEVVLEGRYNQLLSTMRSKGTVLFGQTLRLLQRAAGDLGRASVLAWLDRQGGRTSYQQPLMTLFQDAQLRVLEESSERSSYRLRRAGSVWTVRFVMKGETHHLPIALASIFSKYIRELFMICFNRYWSAHVPDLRPTGGYHPDGVRFLRDIDTVLRGQNIERGRLVRAL